jgi:hypothetical protein
MNIPAFLIKGNSGGKYENGENRRINKKLCEKSK